MSRNAPLSLLLPLFSAFPLLACEDDTGSVVDAAPSPDARDAGGTSPDGPAAADRGSDSTGSADRAGDSGGGDGISPGADVQPDAPLNEQQQRGKYLVENVIACPECHTPRLPNGQLDLSRYMAGDTTCFVKLPNNDCIYTRNLTADATGLLNRTDEEIRRMFLEGVRPAQAGEEALHPIMPYYVFGNMDPDDADAIVAFLRTLPAVRNEIPRRGAAFDLPEPAPAIDLGEVPAPSGEYPDQGAASRGRYLATQVGLCVECHTPHRMGGPTALDETKFFQGGEEFPLELGPVMLTARSKNLTPDVATGIGSWSIAEIVDALRMGKDKMSKGICPPMPTGPMGAYGGLTAQDARDIAHYLKSIPPATSMVMDMCSFPPGP